MHCTSKSGIFKEFYEVNVLTTTDSYQEVPKDLADCMESVIGAVYLDCGGNLEETWRVFRPLFAETLGKYKFPNFAVNFVLTFIVVKFQFFFLFEWKTWGMFFIFFFYSDFYFKNTPPSIFVYIAERFPNGEFE